MMRVGARGVDVIKSVANLCLLNEEPKMLDKKFPDVVNVVVEVPKGSRNKYEFDHESGRIKLNRVLMSSVHYPADYGYIPGTKAEDGDEVDILVLIDEPTFSGCLMEAKPIGILMMEDEKGPDNKVLGVPTGDPLWNYAENISDIPQHLLLEVEEFFLTYKRLESKEVVTFGWKNAQKAREYLLSSV